MNLGWRVGFFFGVFFCDDLSNRPGQYHESHFQKRKIYAAYQVAPGAISALRPFAGSGNNVHEGRGPRSTKIIIMKKKKEKKETRKKKSFCSVSSVPPAKQTSESERYTHTDKRAECKWMKAKRGRSSESG